MARILIVDDEKSILELLSYNLNSAGYQVITAEDGKQALELARREKPDLVVLDLMLPGLDGLEVCKYLRREGSVPILILTARDQEVDKVLGLELGADDYLTKPFSPRELVARVRAILRRTEDKASGEAILTFRHLTIDTARHEVTVGGRPVDLTPREYQLLHVLSANQGRVFTREALLDYIWEDIFYGDTRTIDVHIRHLREKIEDNPSQPKYILTVRGVGYRFGC